MPIWSSLKLWSEWHLCKVLGPETQREFGVIWIFHPDMFSGGFLQGLAQITLCIFTAVFTGYSLVLNRRGGWNSRGDGGKGGGKINKN